MNKEEQILSATLRDRCKRCESRGIPTHTGFLSPAEVDFAESVCIGERARFLLEGGYADAERRVCILLPRDWADETEEPADGSLADRFLCVLAIAVPKGSRALTHRDYLGSLLSLGVERSVIGDILVRTDGADAIVLREMAPFLSQNLTSVGRVGVQTDVLPIDALQTGEQDFEEVRDTVASLRLDSVTASAFHLARGKAQEAIRQGLVSVNGRQTEKPDRELNEGDRISLRGKGKVRLAQIGGLSKKGRIVITIQRYR